MKLTYWIYGKELNIWDVITHEVLACDYSNPYGYYHYIDIMDVWGFNFITQTHGSSFYHRELGDRSYCYMQRRWF